MTNKVRYLFMMVVLCLLSVSCGTNKKLNKFFSRSLKNKKLTKKEIVKKKEIKIGPTLIQSKSQFEDQTEDYGLSGIKATGLFAVDFNNDNWTDLVILPTYYSVPEFFQFNPIKRKFEKISYSPFKELIKFSQLIFADLNKDGTVDLIAGNLSQKTELITRPLVVFKGRRVGKKIFFDEVNEALNTVPHGPASIVLLDYDLDGQLDLYLANWYNYKIFKTKPWPDQLYKGKGLKFFNVSSLLVKEYDKRPGSKIYRNARPSFAATTCDVDQDGWPDVLTSSSSGYGNRLWMNRFQEKTERKFIDMGKETGVAADEDGRLLPRGGGNTFFMSCADYNNDEIMDIFVGESTHPYDSDSRDRSGVLTGSSHKFPFKFLRSEFYFAEDSQGEHTRCDKRAIWFDVNVDGLLDLLVENTGFPPNTRTILFKQNVDKSFDDVGAEFGLDILNPSGTIKIDLNEDGLWDLISGQTNVRNAGIKNRLYVFINRFERNGARSVRFFLQGKKANIDGIGAMVILHTLKTKMRRWVQYSHGAMGPQDEKGVIFGLGKKELLDYVEVVWPIKEVNENSLPKALVRVYALDNQLIHEHMDITLCDSGVWKKGKNDCDSN